MSNSPRGDAAVAAISERLKLNPMGQGRPEQVLSLLAAVVSFTQQAAMVNALTRVGELTEQVLSGHELATEAVEAAARRLATCLGVSADDLTTISEAFLADADAFVARELGTNHTPAEGLH